MNRIFLYGLPLVPAVWLFPNAWNATKPSDFYLWLGNIFGVLALAFVLDAYRYEAALEMAKRQALALGGCVFVLALIGLPPHVHGYPINLAQIGAFCLTLFAMPFAVIFPAVDLLDEVAPPPADGVRLTQQSTPYNRLLDADVLAQAVREALQAAQAGQEPSRE